MIRVLLLALALGGCALVPKEAPPDPLVCEPNFPIQEPDPSDVKRCPPFPAFPPGFFVLDGKAQADLVVAKWGEAADTYLICDGRHQGLVRWSLDVVPPAE